MAVKIRLKRLGRKKRPFFRVVAIDGRSRRDGAEIERLGWYDPLASNGEKFRLNDDRIFHWLKEGAQPSNTVKNLMSQAGIGLRWHLMRAGKSAEEIEAAFQEWEQMQTERRRREEAVRVQKDREGKPSTTEAAVAEAEVDKTPAVAAPETTEAEEAKPTDPAAEALEEAAPAAVKGDEAAVAEVLAAPEKSEAAASTPATPEEASSIETTPEETPVEAAAPAAKVVAKEKTKTAPKARAETKTKSKPKTKTPSKAKAKAKTTKEKSAAKTEKGKANKAAKG